MTIFEFEQQFPAHNLMTQMIFPKSQGFDSWLCFHNYFERVLKRPTIVDLYTFSFNDTGVCVESSKTEVQSDTSVQILVNNVVSDFGIVGCAAVPRMTKQELADAPFVMKPQQTTGFYMIWENKLKNSMDTSHEWDPVRFNLRSTATYTVCLPSSPFIHKRSLFIYNPHANVPIKCVIEREGAVTAVELGPLCSHSIPLTGRADQDIVAQVQGPISTPMTIEESLSGDMHAHHS